MRVACIYTELKIKSKVCKGKTLLGVVNKHLKIKKFVDSAQQCFAFTPQANFPANILNFH